MQNDFEKQVRGKMDELHFQPTEPVWSRIEVQIRRKKDRRRLLWLPVLFVLLAGGGWWWYNSTSDNNIADSAVTPSLSNHENKNVHPDVTGKSSAAGSDITL